MIEQDIKEADIHLERLIRTLDLPIRRIWEINGFVNMFI